MMSAKRFSDYQHNPPKKIQALPEKVVNTLSNFDSRKMKFGQHEFLLDKKGMKHILERHHPSYWNGTTKTKQTFINNHLTPDDIADIVHSVLKQNREELLLKGTNKMYQVTGTVNGVGYVVGLNKGRIGQFYSR